MGYNTRNKHDKFMGGWSWCSHQFNSKIKKPDNPADCWEWLGSLTPTGALYGARKLVGEEYVAQMTQARRISFAEHTGEYPLPGQSIYHSCGNRDCVNPLHMTLDRPTLAKRDAVALQMIQRRK
jgi:hypothetical protein